MVTSTYIGKTPFSRPTNNRCYCSSSTVKSAEGWQLTFFASRQCRGDWAATRWVDQITMLENSEASISSFFLSVAPVVYPSPELSPTSKPASQLAHSVKGYLAWMMDPRFELWVSRRNKWDGGEWEKERGNETGLEHGSLRCERGKIGTRQKRSSTLFLLSGGDNRGKVMTIVRFELASPASAWQSIIRHGFYSFQWGRRHFQFGESYLSPSSLLLCAPLYPRLFFTQIHLSKNELFFFAPPICE